MISISNLLTYFGAKKICNRIPVKQSIENKETDFHAAVRTLSYAMTLIGIWPNIPLNFIQLIIWFTYTCAFFIITIANYAGVVMTDTDFVERIALLGKSVPLTGIIMRYIMFRWQMKPLKNVLQTMNEDWEDESVNTMDADASRRRKIMLKHARTPRIFLIIYILVVWGCWVLFTAKAAIKWTSFNYETTSVVPLPFNSWYPFSTNRSPMYEIVFIFEFISGTLIGIAHSTIDGLLITIIFHLCGQLEILRIYIEEFKTEGRSDEMMRADIKFIVERHKCLLNTSSALEQSFNRILLQQLLDETVHTCLAGFCFLQAMESSNAGSLFTFGFLLMMALLQMFLYGFAGDYLTSQGNLIRMAAYKANWYKVSPSIRKSFLIIMIRAEKPITITAGKFIAMSLNSFTSLLKTAVSYLSVLRAIN